MNPSELSNLPSTFYRVSVKALIFDAEQRLLVLKDSKDRWEIPGGGWEHEESLEQCITRELSEEVQVAPKTIGDVQFNYVCRHEKGYYKLCLAVPVTLESFNFVLGADDLVETRFVTKAELVR